MQKLFALLLCLWTLSVQAVNVEHLYTVRLQAPDGSVAGQSALMSKGLSEVLRRISGRMDISGLPVIQSALQDAGQYVQQFTIEGQEYFAHYDPERLAQLLTSAGIPVWGENRPLTLMWLSVESADGRKLIGSEAKTYSQAVDAISGDLGLPVMLPLLDLEDVSAVSVTDVQGRFSHILEPASKRYGSDAILAVRLQETAAGDWEGRWYLQGSEKQFDWLVDGASLSDQLSNGLSAVAQHLAEDYAIDRQHAPDQPVALVVNQIQSGAQYAQVLAYLRSLAPVQQVQITQVFGDSVEFLVTPIGGGGALKQAIGLDHHLLAMGDQHYRWFP